MCEIKASQIFKRNKELDSVVELIGTQIKKECSPDDQHQIKDVFDKMAATRAEREDVARTIALARAQAAAGDDCEDDLDSVDAERMLTMRLFLKSSISPLSDLSIHLVGLHCVLGSFGTNAPQEPSYCHPYARRHHTVHMVTVSNTAALKTVFSNPETKSDEPSLRFAC